MKELGQILHNLKTLPRTGWLLRGVSNPESLAAHSFGVVFWAIWLCERKQQQGFDLDPYKVALLAMLHDVPEAGTGDLVPRQKKLLFGEQEKQKSMIHQAEERFWNELPDETFVPTTFFEAWQEYRQGDTEEAKLVKQADALDCFVQACMYHERRQGNLEEFFYLKEKACGGDPELQKTLQQLWEQSLPKENQKYE